MGEPIEVKDVDGKKVTVYGRNQALVVQGLIPATAPAPMLNFQPSVGPAVPVAPEAVTPQPKATTKDTK